MATKRDYYEVLGVAKSASAEEVKRAYRKLAMQHHPDKHGGDDAKFKELGEAYEVLKDPQKRAAYDQFGHAGPQMGGGGGAGGFNAQGFDFNNFDFGGAGFDFGDIFSQFMGGARQQREPAGRDVEIGLPVEFEEAVFGATKVVALDLDQPCPHCHGSTAEPGSKLITCKTCNGRGQVSRTHQTILGAISQTQICPTCHGRGQQPEQACTRCHGAGVLRQAKQLSVKIPAGVDDGTTIRLNGEGAATIGGHKGNLYVHVRVKPSREFQRQGQNILSAAAIGMAEAALGTTIPVRTVDGEVQLKIPAGTQSGKVFKLSERSVPGLGGRRRGDHLVTINVETPTKLTARQKTLLEQFAAEGGKKGFWR